MLNLLESLPLFKSNGCAPPSGITVAEGIRMHLRVGMTVLYCMVSGCLVPPPVEQIGSFANQPPRIITRSLLPPPNHRPLRMQVSCLQDLQFTASVEDPDFDTIYYKIFVDHWANPGQNARVIRLEAPPDGSARSFQFTESIANFTEQAEGIHTVELYVADRPFIGDGADTQNAGRAVADDGEVDSFVWTLVFDETAQCPF